MDFKVVTLFVLIVVVTLLITYYASKKTNNASSFYTAGGGLTGWQNGFAIAGDFMSASSFLGLIGAISLIGYDGFFLMYGALVSYLVVLLLVAEPLRNLGKYTLADMIAERFQTKKVRGVTAFNALTISVFYMLAQLVAAGALFKLLLNINYEISVVIVGLVMLTFVVFGGMTATSWVQITKAFLLLGGTFLIFIMVMAKFDFNFLRVFEEMKTATPLKEAYLNPGVKYTNGLDAISLTLGLVLGTAGLPHVLSRFLTVPNAQVARKSVVYSIWIIGLFYVMVIFLGFAAAKFVGTTDIVAANPAGNMAAPLLAKILGGDTLFAVISAVSFATILAVVAGIVLTGATAFSHDFYNEIIKGGKATEKEQVRMARLASIGITVLSIVLALFVQKINVAFLASLALTVAASSNLPVILFTVYWKRFNITGAITGMLVGLFGTIILVALSPNVWSAEAGKALFVGTPIFPLASPGIVSIPLGFLGAYVGTILSTRKSMTGNFQEILVKTNTGSDVKGVSHY
ncbi:solute symporter family protein [Aneurinibacillus migulanus]|uniref:Symporter n=1 Tax=Aneurinibacillus migulanus TaxID=47500 RepID=A0A0D1XUQ3_ANEMI|nr:cation acetate symporter [Aneurinibacillus migulanus]KIV57921.1 symporter [Aneurinibacillus migulanus]KON97316.1 symporter [Aneurinibacillus migulanus]MED0894010.1 cation acetate symporter [Aneurinibacillus migulanus]MED1616775.1 cation acetate symporter [Aneurinibacillus migulanus]SDJ02036.1 cation/acetate symporter [Aneurinibacillus migulanus]